MHRRTVHRGLGLGSASQTNNERVPRAYLRAFISPLMGGRMVADGGNAPTVGRSADACPCESEKQAEVAGLTAE